MLKFQNQTLPEETTLHQVGLYCCLETRYRAGFQSKSEVELWGELAPFLNLAPDNGLKALAEYIVYKEMPAKADMTKLIDSLREGWGALSKDEQKAIEVVAKMNNFAWIDIL